MSHFHDLLLDKVYRWLSAAAESIVAIHARDARSSAVSLELLLSFNEALPEISTDETRPECERCKKSGLKCEGYSLNLVIVGPQDGLSCTPTKLAVWSPQTIDANGRQETPQNRRPRPLRPKPQPQIRSLLPSQDTVLTAHIVSRFSPSGNVEASAPATLLPQLIKMDKSYSAQALSAIYFGKMRNQYQIYQKGTQLYVRALDQLRNAINDPARVRQNETLTSVLCLCLYEHIVLSETTAWLKHYQGVGRLVENRGPECHQTEFEKDIFRICRFMIVSEDTDQRETPC